MKKIVCFFNGHIWGKMKLDKELKNKYLITRIYKQMCTRCAKKQYYSESFTK